MSYSNLSMIERGKRSMYVEHLPALAKALGVSVQYLLGVDEPGVETMPTPEAAPPATPTAKRKRTRKGIKE